jgi:sulfopyruvate decarboxylase subunit beta
VEATESFAKALSSAFRADALQVIVLATEPDLNVVQPPIALDPVLTKHRFMAAIGAPRYIPTIFGGGGRFE